VSIKLNRHLYTVQVLKNSEKTHRKAVRSQKLILKEWQFPHYKDTKKTE